MRVPSWAPTAAVLLVAATAMVRVLTAHWREGGVLLGAALLLAALLRVVLAPESAGLLVIRGRGLDVLAYAGLGLAIVFLAVTITDQQLTLT